LRLRRPGDGFGLPLFLLVGGGFAGGGLGVGGGLVGDAPQGQGFGDGREGGGGLVAFEVCDGVGEGGEDAALAGPGVHADGHEQAQGFLPAGSGLDLDGAGGHGGEHGQGEHAGQVGWGLGGGGDRRDIVPQPAGQHFDREGRHISSGADRDGRRPPPPVTAGGGVGQLAGEVSEDVRVGSRVGQADAEVDDPPATGGVGDQAGVMGGVGHGGHGLNEGVQERTPAYIGQLAGVVELPQ
jgi:hypothetical protein